MSSWTFESKVEIKELEKIARKIGRLDEMLESVAEQVKQETVKNIETKDIIDTGALRDSIAYEMQREGFILHDGVTYGIYNEFGTWKMAARPFMIPAAEKFGDITFRKFTELMR